MKRILPSIIIILGIVVPPAIFWKIGGSVAVLAGYGASLLVLALLVGTASRGPKARAMPSESDRITEINATGHVQLSSSEAQRNNG